MSYKKPISQKPAILKSFNLPTYASLSAHNDFNLGGMCHYLYLEYLYIKIIFQNYSMLFFKMAGLREMGIL